MVISLDSFNATMSIVVVAAMTTEIKPAFRIAPVLPAGRPLKKAGQILPFQVQTIDQARLDGYMGMLDSSQIEDLKAALRTSWGL